MPVLFTRGNTKCQGTKVWLVRALGPRWSLARLLDVLGPRGGMPVYGGMGLLVGHLGGRWREVLVTPGDDSGDKHGRLGWTGAFPLLVVLVLLFSGVSRMRVFLHNSHPTSFHGGRMSSFRLQLPLGRRRHGAKPVSDGLRRRRARAARREAPGRKVLDSQVTLIRLNINVCSLLLASDKP